MKWIGLLFLAYSSIGAVIAQNISTKSNLLSLDFSDGKDDYNSSLPKIQWTTPQNEVSFRKDGKVQLTAAIDSRHRIANVILVLREKTSGVMKVSSPVSIEDRNGLAVRIDKEVTLPEGIHIVEIVAENEHGLKSTSRREFHIGATVLADAAKLDRTDYALIFATDKYDSWSQLVNPIFDARAIAQELETAYGFQTDIVENPTQEEMFIKLREYAEKKYKPLDQLFIFIAGHGFFDETFKEGFVVTKESLPSDPGRTSYVRHSSLRSAINNNPCEHILLVMDVCFGGTFDEDRIHRGEEDAVYAEASQSEIIIRKLQFRTRKYLTSGGKEYVSDGIPGKHSPFAKQFIEALRGRGGNDGILTLSELLVYVERLKTAPQFGTFGADKQGSEFVFVVK